MGNLFINSISYIGDKYFYNSPNFKSGVNIIEGENGNGKSTFMNLIYFCLGGDVKKFNPSESNTEKHELITKDINNYVELDILINNDRYILRRSIGKNFISISDSKGNIETYSINRNENSVIFSDWILSKLGIRILDIYQGSNTFKLNIKDLFRLIYHDQNPDPKKVFKSPDVNSFISDSEYIRKLIFRVLLGKSFEEYYEKLGSLLKSDNDKKIAQSLYNEFDKLSTQLYSDNSEILNLEYLKLKIDELNSQLQKLNETRELLKANRPNESDSAWKEIDLIKSEIITIEIELQNFKEKYNNESQEFHKYERYRGGIIKEVTQLNKIIHAHKTLEVFTPNSCPFCLGEMKRVKDQCYCGNSIEEETFEKFIFSSDEYWDLLKARKKSVETVDLVISAVKLDIITIDEKINYLSNKSDRLKSEIREKLSKVDQTNIDVEKLNEIDDKSLSVKNEIQILLKKLEFEEKLKGYKSNLEQKEQEYKRLLSASKILEIKANQEMESTVRDFNEEYNSLMMATLKDCRSAKIDSDSYDPIIDGGIYREASARVSIRFNYYLTILKMALKNPEIKFPRFLMIDTPQTAGIDTEELKKLIGQLSELKQEHYQVILTTAHGLYPNDLKDSVVERLSDNDKLLKVKV